MAVTFAQAAELVADPVRRGAIETAAAVSWVWDRMPFENIEGNSYSYDKDRVLPGTAFRTVNEAYVESTGVINQATESLVILGGDADVDRFIERTMSSARGVLLADQIRMKLESAQATYVSEMFNGDVNVNPKGFDGLRKRLVGEQVLVATANLTQTAALADLDALFATVDGGPDVVYTSADLLGAYKTLARSVGGAEYILSEMTGKREWTWNGVPFIDPGNHWTGNKILPNNSGELYAIKFANSVNEVGVMGIQNGLLDCYVIGELQEKPAFRARIDYYPGLVVQGGRAAARLRGIAKS